MVVKTFAVKEHFDRIGIRREPFDLAFNGWAPDYNDAGAFLAPLASGTTLRKEGNSNVAYFNDPKINARIAAASLKRGAARRDAWADLDVDLMRDNPPWLPSATPSDESSCPRASAATSTASAASIWLRHVRNDEQPPGWRNAYAHAAAGTVTFLFSDVSGSTRLLRELGQDHYGQALAHYQQFLREACTSRGGHEVDTQGDAIFFAFSRAKDAVNAAAEAQRSLAAHAWPGQGLLKARIGLHTGEASVSEGRYLGLSVHRAARVCSAAAGGQVLLSQASAGVLEDEDLGELRLRPLGRHLLKDFEHPVQLYQLDVPGLPVRFPPPTTARRKVRRKRALLWLGGAALIAAAVAIPLALIGGGADEGTRLGPTDAGILDPKVNQVIGGIPLGFKSPLVAEGEGYVWVVDPRGSTVTKIDPRTRKVVGSPSAVGGTPTGIAVGGGSVWVAVNRGSSLAVVELNPKFVDSTDRFVIDRSSTGSFSPSVPVLLAFGGKSLWALEVETGQVWRIDPASGRMTPLTDGADAWSIAYGHGYVWLGGQTTVTRLDPVTGDQTRQDLPQAPSTSRAIAVGHGTVWFAANGEPTLFRIKPRTMAVSHFPVARGPSAIAVDDQGVWVASRADRSVTRVDPETGNRRTIPVGNPPAGIVSSSGLLWTTPGEPVSPLLS